MKLSNSLFLDRETKYDIENKIGYLNVNTDGILTDQNSSSSDIQKKKIQNGIFKKLNDVNNIDSSSE